MKHEQFLDQIIKTLADWKEKTDSAEATKKYSETMVTLEMFRSWASRVDTEKEKLANLLVEFSKGSLRALLLINTGGIFIIMTMISAAISKGDVNKCLVSDIATTAVYFIVGISFAVLTTLGSYFTQWLYLNVENQKFGVGSNILTMLFGAISFILFLFGAVALRGVFVLL